MLKRSVRIQLLAFAIAALLGVSYVGARYAGITQVILGRGGCTVTADFPDSGGIFDGAEVTYRGVGIGKVGGLHLLKDGVRVDLFLNSCSKPRLPAATSAIVADRSAVGEQYVNLVADKDEAPYVGDGGNLPMAQNKLPIATQVFLNSFNNLNTSIDSDKLRASLHELGLAFSDRGPDLGSLADSIDQIVEEAVKTLPQTQALIASSNTVLKTQLNEGSAIQSWASSLNKLSETFNSSNGDVQKLLNTGPDGFAAVRTFVKNNQDGLGVLFANLTTTGQVMTANIGNLKEVLTLLPMALDDGLVSAPGDGYLHAGFISPSTGGATPTTSSPIYKPVVGPWCVAGYEGTKKRNSTQTEPAAANTSARCTDNTTLPRGAANTPSGDSVTTGGGGTIYPRATTENILRIGQVSQPNAAALGDNGWITVFTSSMN